MSEEFEGKNLVELLAMLEPVPEPEPVSLTPQTEAWAWLGAAMVVILCLIASRLRARRAAEAYRRQALREIAAEGVDAAELARIVRRAALAAFPREQVASLHGEKWLAFLDETIGGRVFRDGAGRALATAPYRGDEADPELARVAEDWIRRHRRPETRRRPEK